MTLFYIISSFAIGFGLGLLFFYKKPVEPIEPIGTIRVDRSIADDPPHLFLELENHGVIDRLKHGDTVCCKISTENYISQE